MLTVRRQNSTSTIPQRQSEEAAGCDIYTVDSGIINPNESRFVHTGIVLVAKPNSVGVVFGRSGLSNKYLLEIESPLIHSENKDELVIFVTNNGNVPYCLKKMIELPRLFSWKPGVKLLNEN